MTSIFGPISSGISAGGAGVSTNNASSNVRLMGKVNAIYVKYNDAPPATTDVIIKTVGSSPAIPTLTLLTLTDKNTNGLFRPRAVPHDTVGVALAALVVAEPFSIYDFINVSIAQANDGDSVDVWFVLE